MNQENQISELLDTICLMFVKTKTVSKSGGEFFRLDMMEGINHIHELITSLN